MFLNGWCLGCLQAGAAGVTPLKELQGDTWKLLNLCDSREIIRLDNASMKQKVQHCLHFAVLFGYGEASWRSKDYCQRDARDQLFGHVLSSFSVNCAVNQLIQRCRGVSIQIDPKVNSVLVDGCENVRLCVNSLISGAEFVNCRKMKFQVTGVCPSIAIDKCVGIDLFVSAASKNVTITSCRSGEMNLNFPKGDKDGDWSEVAIPEQFHHKLEDGVLQTRVSDLYTH